MTITIQIGNSDDKLTQKEWSLFVSAVRREIAAMPHTDVHFFGCASAYSQWQNACWVVETWSNVATRNLKKGIQAIRQEFRQDSVAWTQGKTLFIV